PNEICVGRGRRADINDIADLQQLVERLCLCNAVVAHEHRGGAARVRRHPRAEFEPAANVLMTDPAGPAHADVKIGEFRCREVHTPHPGSSYPSRALAKVKQPRLSTELLSLCHHMVDLRGFEPLTSSMRTRRATNCAI